MPEQAGNTDICADREGLMTVKELADGDIRPDMMEAFNNYQKIERRWVKKDSAWVLEDVSLVHEWDDKKRRWVPRYLLQQLKRGGAVFGAFENDRLAGFASLDGGLAGAGAQYVNLTMFFVDLEYRGSGVGRALFAALRERAGCMGVGKIYISAVPAVNTIAFYSKLGCIDATEVIPEFEDSPDDRPLEFAVL